MSSKLWGRLRTARAETAVVTTILGLAACAIAPATASAHAELARASPSPGARLQAPPAQLVLTFTEPLDRGLSTARIIVVRSHRQIPATVRFPQPTVIVLRPGRRLSRGSYLVRWHSVSADDGHTLDGSFYFGLGVAATQQTQAVASTLDAGGILHAGLRALWYAALFFFGGGVLCGVLLRSPRGPAGWLVPVSDATRSESVGSPRVESIWRRTKTAGWLAAAAAAAVALADAASAAGGLHWQGIENYLLSTQPGIARLVAAVMVLLAVAVVDRWLPLAALALLGALLALSFGGHADSASPRALALAADWVHLIAAVVWAGGIAQIVATWLPGVRLRAVAERRRVMREVLARFGTLALPAFIIVAVAGVTEAVVELKAVQRLWTTGYGAALLVKITVVALIAAASWAHALRLRPRLLRAAGGTGARSERSHWRLLGLEPPLTAIVLAAGALLAVLPLPAENILAAADARQPQSPGIVPPNAAQLAVAEEAGPWIAAAWVDPPAPGVTSGTLRLLNSAVEPVPARLTISGARTTSCGRGCVAFRFNGDVASLRLQAALGAQHATASLPIRWLPGGTIDARKILAAAVNAIGRLGSFEIAERLSTGTPGPPAITTYRISGRHDFRTTYSGQTFGQTIGLGTRTWVLEPGGRWQEQSGPPLDTRTLMPWFEHRFAVRLLDISTGGGHRIADVALADIRPLSIEVPLWFRLRIDLRSDRVLAMRMIAPAHFMNQHYYGFDTPIRIAPPPREDVSP